MILAIGDSNLYPACTESNQPIDPDNMAAVFAAQMVQPLRNWSKNGASNFWIEQHLEYFLADATWSPDTFLFVGWTSFEREEWPWLYSNISVCGGPDFGMPDPMKARFNQWKETLTDEFYQERKEFWHARIHATHLRLRQRGIPHLFWTTYANFIGVEKQLDWHGNFFEPYAFNGCMSRYLESQGVVSFDNDPFHYDSSAHRLWATALCNHVREQGL